MIAVIDAAKFWVESMHLTKLQTPCSITTTCYSELSTGYTFTFSFQLAANMRVKAKKIDPAISIDPPKANVELKSSFDPKI